MSAVAMEVQGDILGDTNSKPYSIHSTAGAYLQRRFNVTEDELTIENLEKFQAIEKDRLAENGLGFATDEELRNDVQSLKNSLGLD